MSAQPFRLPRGGLIDRDRTLGFTFDGRALTGHPGDTLASALLANGVRVVGRSFKYHRPRGILSAGSEEPNALVRIGEGAAAEPNTRATMVPLRDGLVVTSQNRFPSLAHDWWRINDLLSPLFPAGFYYKTFMAPRRGWRLYEALIRRAAGLGAAVPGPDPDRYEHRSATCDVLVIGAGPAGLAAALAASASGRSVMLVDEGSRAGGSLLDGPTRLDGRPAGQWVGESLALLATRGAQILCNTTAFGCYDHRAVALLQRLDESSDAGTRRARERRWLVRAGRIILATGAVERPFVFAGNDRPGIMLAGAVSRYLRRHAVASGRRAVVFTNNPAGYRMARDLTEAGVAVAAVVDARPDPAGSASLLDGSGIAILAGHAVTAAQGRPELAGVDIAPLDARGHPSGRTTRIACDLLCVSAGFSPSVHLHAQAGGTLRYDGAIAAFVPEHMPPEVVSIGAARGAFALVDCLRDGAAAGGEATMPLPAPDPEPAFTIRPLWDIAGGRGKRFVDLQDDATAADLALALREGYRSIEHVKRYTTLGMGTDQGKTSGLNGLAIVAGLRGEPIGTVGTTTFRPPFTPVTLGALAGEATGAHFDPERRTPLHDWHAAHGAVSIQAGLWLRPRAYPHPGESFDAAWRREALAVRRSVGLFDVSTLGKIDVRGPDAAAFLDRVYCCSVGTLAIGRCRYGLMLREDGILLDDGTIARTGDETFLLSSSTAHAARVMSHLAFLAVVAWPDLRVHLTDVTEPFAQFALAGPASRRVLTAASGRDLSDAVLPHLGTIPIAVAGVPARAFRMSFSGELTYELAVPAGHAAIVWEHLLSVGAREGIAPCGVEALGVLRIEKGHVAGPEIDGRTTPADLGLAGFVSRRKDFLGKVLLGRPALAADGRLALVGLEPADGRSPIRAGAQLIGKGGVAPAGHVTSATFSPNLGRPIALALLAGGIARAGEELAASSPLFGDSVAVRVVPPRFYDPENRRLHG